MPHDAISAMVSLPSNLRDAVAESARRNTQPDRVSFTRHLRTVLVERGLLGTWIGHFRHGAQTDERAA